jgi:hypothetical protein
MEDQFEPISAVLNLRDGNFGRSLRNQKGHLPSPNITIYHTDKFEDLIAKIRQALPQSFEWNPAKEPPRYQRNNQTSQSTLEPIFPDTDFFSIFDELRSRTRRMANLDSSLSIWVFGSTTSSSESEPKKRTTRIISVSNPKPKSSEIHTLGATDADATRRRYSRLYPGNDGHLSNRSLLFQNQSESMYHPYNIPQRSADRRPLPAKSVECDCEDCTLERPRYIDPTVSHRLERQPVLPSSNTQTFVPLNVMLNGISVPLIVDVTSLREALNLGEEYISDQENK